MHPEMFDTRSYSHEEYPGNQYNDHDQLEGCFSPGQSRDSNSTYSFTDEDEDPVSIDFHRHDHLCVTYISV